MKLITITGETELKQLLGENCSFERNGQNALERIIIGDPKCPTAVIRKSGTYTDNIEVSVPETKEIFKSITTIRGAKIEKTGSVEEVAAWEAEIERDFPEPGRSFDRKSAKVLVS